jgi:hypothetical protein
MKRTAGRQRTEETKQIVALKPGEWVDLGEYTPNLKRRYRDRIEYLQKRGEVSRNVRIIHNAERRIIVVHLPPKLVGGGVG